MGAARQDRARDCALGFVAHTGWAAAVVVGTGARVEVIDRRRVELVPGGFERAGVYHAAEELPLPAARRLVESVRKIAERNAREVIAALITDLEAGGHRPRACAIVGAAPAPELDLEATLASHARIHAAEGELYRRALAAGAEANALPVSTVPARELDLEADGLRALARELGPPWGKDQKLAALAARSIGDAKIGRAGKQVRRPRVGPS